MKKIIFALCVSLMASQLMAIESVNADLKEFKREVTKEYSVGTNPKLNIDNRYGNIRIIEGADNRISFKIEIIGKANTEALAKEYAETVSIDFSQSGDNVAATTNLRSINCNNCGRETHYTVVAPKSVTMALTNKYGNIVLDNSVKPLTIDLKYGGLEANNLANVTIDLKYGHANINACAELNLNCAYSKIKIGTADRITTESKYDDFQIGTVSTVLMDTKYTQVKIDRLNNSFVCDDFKYCGLNIAEVSTQFSQIKVNAGYSQIRLGLDNRHSFKASLKVRYGSIKTNNLTFNNVSFGDKQRNAESINGTAGSASNPSATVEISNEYGEIVFN